MAEAKETSKARRHRGSVSRKMLLSLLLITLVLGVALLALGRTAYAAADTRRLLTGCAAALFAGALLCALSAGKTRPQTAEGPSAPCGGAEPTPEQPGEEEPEEAQQDGAELVVDATDENLDKVLAFVDAQLEALDCPMKAQIQIDVAVEELFVNIAHYAYAPQTGSAALRVQTQAEPKTVSITFIDRGIPYDPLAKPDPDVTLPAEQRQIGGLGIYMVKKSMDEVRYEYRDGQNVLTIVKQLDAAK